MTKLTSTCHSRIFTMIAVLLCEPEGKCWQSKSSASLPGHWTLSRAIIAGDGPKFALVEGKEEGGREHGTNIFEGLAAPILKIILCGKIYM